jgi:hypothetical protein
MLRLQTKFEVIYSQLLNESKVQWVEKTGLEWTETKGKPGRKWPEAKETRVTENISFLEPWELKLHGVCCKSTVKNGTEPACIAHL